MHLCVSRYHVKLLWTVKQVSLPPSLPLCLTPSPPPSLSLSLSILPFRPSYNVSSFCELCRLFPISCFFLFLCLFIVDLFFKAILYLLVNLISPLFFFLFFCFFLSPFPSCLFVTCLSLISVSHFSISQYFSFFHSFSDLLMAVLIRHQYTHGWSSNVLKLLPFFFRRTQMSKNSLVSLFLYALICRKKILVGCRHTWVVFWKKNLLFIFNCHTLKL